MENGKINLVRERTLRLRLTEEEAVALAETAASVGMPLRDLLESFVHDLIGNGDRVTSDFAEKWLNRDAFFCTEKVFTAYMAKFGALETARGYLDNMEDCRFEMVYAETREDHDSLRDEAEWYEQQLRDLYDEYTAFCKPRNLPVQSWTDALEQLRQYQRETHDFLYKQ